MKYKIGFKDAACNIFQSLFKNYILTKSEET